MEEPCQIQGSLSATGIPKIKRAQVYTVTECSNPRLTSTAAFSAPPTAAARRFHLCRASAEPGAVGKGPQTVCLGRSKIMQKGQLQWRTESVLNDSKGSQIILG